MRALPRCALALLLASFASGVACCITACDPVADTPMTAPAASGGGAPSSATCPARAAAQPARSAPHETLAYWIGRHSDLDAPLLTEAQIAAYNATLGRRPGDHPASQRDLLDPVDARLVARDLRERLRHVGERARDGRLVDARGASLDAAALAAFDARASEGPLSPVLRVALAPIALRCGPYSGALHEPGAPRTYDRNACSTVRAQEPLLVLAQWSNGLLLAQTRYARGFIAADAPLSPPVPDELAETVVRGARGRASEGTKLAAVSGGEAMPAIAAGTTLPLATEGTAWIATESGLQRVRATPALQPTRRALTRRAVLEQAFAMHGAPYGLGDADGGRDCSRLLLDLFEGFDLALPRHSGWQAQAGSYRLDVSQASEAEKLQRIDRAARSGVVLLAFPGHIMLDLGAREDGTRMVMHALGEYVQPCPGGGETVVDVQRVLVSALDLGRGSSRRSLLERVTTLVVFGAEPPAELASVALRPPPPPPTVPGASVECGDHVDARLFVSPRKPTTAAPLRVIATASRASERSELWLFDPDGALVRAPLHRLGGPPFSVWAELPKLRAGRYTALWTDGDATLACKRIAVREPQREVEAPSSAVWEPRFRWERDTNHLWSAFVEQLFDDAPDDERTWSNLHELLRDRSRNLLHGHLGLDEDAALELVPDCADLPFALRAYFAWKLKLPFAFRRCSRGRTGAPPTCGEPNGNLVPREAQDELGAFSIFVNRHVRSGVHSASGRTAPADEATDLYPVALERDSLPPGTVYADPYGHVMILTKWIPRARGSGEGYGILMAAEAQPDNTVGRRRFSRGSFLFDPSTRDVGAGFKHFRPLTFDRPSGALVPLDNAALAQTQDHPRYSAMQYEGSLDDFYERVDRLINPHPLDPTQRLTSLLDAFEEAVVRRVLSVDLGERFHATDARVIPMPIGHEVFETTGPWEDYSTPSRDLRLLIALDELLGLPARVRAHPDRFALTGDADVEPRIAEIEAALERELSKRTFTYTRSDGSAQVLPLAALRERAAALERAYNPNDCAELRWGAPEGSAELATCKRRAPRDQAQRMERYRTWFHTRTRPARGARDP